MELPVKAMVAVAILLLVLVSYTFFLYSQSSQKLSEAEANQIFYSACSEYRKNDCDWSATYEQQYGDYMKACSVLFGNEAGRYSCLYRFCCEQTQNVLCSGLCSSCRAKADANTGTETCCSRFATECGEEACGVCR